MKLHMQKRDAVHVVAIEGKVDAMSGAELQTRLSELIEDDSARLVLHMGGVPYVSSAGLRVILLFTKRLHGKGGFALCHLNAEVREILEMAGFHNFISIEDTVEDALIAFQPS